MTHDELLTKISFDSPHHLREALRTVVELHKPFDGFCRRCTINNWGQQSQEYPCDEIQAIEKELG